MKTEIRHRRLHAFFNSKVLNALMIVVIVSLLQTGRVQSMTVPVVCASIALAMFLGYTLWLWLKKPKRIVIDKRLSGINGWFTLYFLIVAAIKTDNQWWYALPLICSIVLLFLCLVRPKDEIFVIE